MLSVVLPTLDEAGNVAELVRRLDDVLDDVRWEAIFVDDGSTDGTLAELDRLARADARVRRIERIGRRGLASACVEGVLSSSAPFVAVMDADLQHDEALLPRMLARLQAGDVDIVIGSRHVAGGGADWQGVRPRMSRLAARLSRMIVPAPLSDPMSGFFMMRREAFRACCPRLSAVGFKILLDLFASSPMPLRFAELPYHFRDRVAGESKLDGNVLWNYLLLLLDKSIGRYVPLRFISFGLIGGAGVGVHMAVLALALKGAGLSFVSAQALATWLAMSFNFFLNNALTYSDRRLRGWAVWWGLLGFYLACGIGAAANVGVAGVLFAHQQRWWVAGVAGVLISAVWNYAATSFFIWRKRA